MKLLHTADWHLGKRLENFSRLEEQKQVLSEICDIAEREQVDAVLIAGDLYDHINPSVEATELLYQTLHRLANGGKRAVIGIAGNHDSPDRIEAPDPLARACGIILTGYPTSEVRPFELETGLKVLESAPGFVTLQLPQQKAPLRLMLTPYANEVRLRKFLGDDKTEDALREILQQHWAELSEKHCDGNGVNILMTHLFVTAQGKEVEMAALEDEGEKSLATVGGAQQIYLSNLPQNLQYVALGHLHGYIPLQKEPYPVTYSSSPLTYSVDDRQPQKYVVIVDAEPGQPATTERIPLTSGKKVLRQCCEGVAEALQWLGENPGCLVELTLVIEEHLSAQDRKRILDAHDGIIRIIPEFTNPELMQFTSGKQIDLKQDIQTLFAQYFQHKKGMPLNEDLEALFQEVLNSEK